MRQTIEVILVLSVLIFFTQCKEETNLEPTCKISNLTNGNTFYNDCMVTVSVNAEDGDGNITEVRISINNVGVASLKTFPYNYEWDIQGITPGTYSISAIAYDNDGSNATASVQVVVKPAPEDLVDGRDGNNYETVYIGDQLWMAENMAYNAGANSWAYDNNDANVPVYGRLYTWEVANDVCPDGWHLPLKGEWQEMVDYLGGEFVAGGKLKSTGTSYWENNNDGATNESGFSAYPAGCKQLSGTFNYIGYYTYFWTSTNNGTTEAYYYKLESHTDNATNYADSKDIAFSVRCVKDE